MILSIVYRLKWIFLPLFFSLILSENDLLNSKLKSKSEVSSYLVREFAKKSSDPYNDTHEVEATIASTKDATTYEFVENLQNIANTMQAEEFQTISYDSMFQEEAAEVNLINDLYL